MLSDKKNSVDNDNYNDNCNDHDNIELTFTSEMKTHSIIVELDMITKEALINDMQIQYSSPVELALLLKKMITELKKINIHFIIQQVTESDWLQILKPLNIFIFVNKNKTYGFLNIKCPIDDFPEAVMKALGFVDL